MIYSACKILITQGRYEYADMYAKLDVFLLMDRISMEEYLELIGMMTEEAEETPMEEPEAGEPEGGEGE